MLTFSLSPSMSGTLHGYHETFTRTKNNNESLIDIYNNVSDLLDRIDDINCEEIYAALGSISRIRSKSINKERAFFSETKIEVGSLEKKIVDVLKVVDQGNMRSAHVPESDIENNLVAIWPDVFENPDISLNQIASPIVKDASIPYEGENENVSISVNNYIPVFGYNRSHDSLKGSWANVSKMRKDVLSFQIPRLTDQNMKEIDDVDEWYNIPVDTGVFCTIQASGSDFNVVTEFGEGIRFVLAVNLSPSLFRGVLSRSREGLKLELFDLINSGGSLEGVPYDRRRLILKEKVTQLSGIHVMATVNLDEIFIEFIIPDELPLTVCNNFVEGRDHLLVRNNHNYYNTGGIFFVSSKSRFEIEIKNGFIVQSKNGFFRSDFSYGELGDGRYFCTYFQGVVEVFARAWEYERKRIFPQFGVNRYSDPVVSWKSMNAKVLVYIFLKIYLIEINGNRANKIRRRTPYGVCAY